MEWPFNSKNVVRNYLDSGSDLPQEMEKEGLARRANRLRALKRGRLARLEQGSEDGLTGQASFSENC